MPVWATALLTIIQNAPQLYNEAKAIYDDIGSTLSSDDAAVVEKALSGAKARDASATAAADAALTTAALRP